MNIKLNWKNIWKQYFDWCGELPANIADKIDRKAIQSIVNTEINIILTKKYTHKDKDGMFWRFEGGRPVSKLADEVMKEILNKNDI